MTDVFCRCTVIGDLREKLSFVGLIHRPTLSAICVVCMCINSINLSASVKTALKFVFSNHEFIHSE